MKVIFFSFILCVCAFKPVFSADGDSQRNSKDRPNIILFFSDDHGADDLGYTGNEDVSTPVLDRLASEGMVFTRAFAPVSICAPSRSALYTGLYPHRNGCHQQNGRIFETVKTLPTYLGEQGYRVALAGKVHVAPESAFPFEYIEIIDVPAFLESVGERPFCLIIANWTPHEPYFNKKNGVDYRKIKAKEWMPDTPETRKLTAGYYDNVENLDNEIGTSLYWIEKIGIPENTIQIYTSDHGSGLPYCKWTLYEKGLHVPFFVKWNGIIEPGTRSDALISLVDLLPTFLELAGVDVPQHLDGKSIVPLINGETAKHHEYIYGAYTNLGVNKGTRYPIRSIRNDRYKLIINFNYQDTFSIRITNSPDERSTICAYRAMESWKNCSDAHTSAEERYNNFTVRPKIEFYDLKNDPFELRNIYDHESYKKIQHTLLEEMKNWLRSQKDPILNETKNFF